MFRVKILFLTPLFFLSFNSERKKISATSSKDDLHRRIGGRCSTNNMKVVFKVCCAPETDQQNTTTTINSNNNNNNQVQKSNNNQQGFNGGSRGVSINTNIDSQSPNGGRVPPVLVNASNNVSSNVVQSTMSWPSWGGNAGSNDNTGGYLHSTPLTSTLSVQQYYPHHTSPRPNINSAINNNNYNSNSNNSNYEPSRKPTKKTSKSQIEIIYKLANGIRSRSKNN